MEAVYVSESSRVDLYLHSSTRPKLLELCQNVLLKAFLRELLEREGSGLRALLRDIPVDQASTGGLALGNPVSSSAGGAGGSAMGRSGSVGAPQGGKVRCRELLADSRC